MMYCLIGNQMVVAAGVDKNKYAMAIKCPDDIVFGDRYEDGEWVRCGARPEAITLPSKEIRKQEYEGNLIIPWENKYITVDQANRVYLEYFAEGSPKSLEIQELIAGAKAHIRELYPDEEAKNE